MLWVAGILIFLVLAIVLLLLSVIELVVDTRIPMAGIHFGVWGSARIWHKDGWLLYLHVPFYHKTIPLTGSIRKGSKAAPVHKDRPLKKRIPLKKVLKKSTAVLKTFSVDEYTLAVDTGDFTVNARLYPLNFLPGARNHLFINFHNNNFLVLKLHNYPWRMLYALLR
ncbi:MAG: hypothetical protein JST86_12210 [Bacteroidetes bacterium]|nr:hypothetical protein [Bacteroidota bacterium]